MASEKAIAAVNGLSFGVEIETRMPRDCQNLSVGGYHNGISVTWLRASRGDRGSPWRAERDGSIRCESQSEMPCEFVSPILKGIDGIENVRDAAKAIRERGGKVNESCGIHVTVSFPANDAAALARLLCLVANHERALYAATGTLNREAGIYCKPIKPYNAFASAEQSAKSDRYHLVNLAHLARGANRVEFRVFSGSLNPDKITGFVLLALGLVALALGGPGRRSPWNFTKKGMKSCWDRAGYGEGQTELCRLFYRLGWIQGWYKGDDRGTLFGVPQNDGEAVGLEAAKGKLMQMAAKYDQHCETHHVVPLPYGGRALRARPATR